MKCARCYIDIDEPATYEYAVEKQHRLCIACYLDEDGEVPFDFACPKCGTTVASGTTPVIDTRDGAALCSTTCLELVGGQVTPVSLVPPAPWRIAKSGISVDAGMIRIRLESGSWDEKRAIVRVIAAAPELISTLADVVKEARACVARLDARKVSIIADNDLDASLDDAEALLARIAEDKHHGETR